MAKGEGVRREGGEDTSLPPGAAARKAPSMPPFSGGAQRVQWPSGTDAVPLCLTQSNVLTGCRTWCRSWRRRQGSRRHGAQWLACKALLPAPAPLCYCCLASNLCAPSLLHSWHPSALTLPCGLLPPFFTNLRWRVSRRTWRRWAPPSQPSPSRAGGPHPWLAGPGRALAASCRPAAKQPAAVACPPRPGCCPAALNTRRSRCPLLAHLALALPRPWPALPRQGGGAGGLHGEAQRAREEAGAGGLAVASVNHRGKHEAA